MGQLAITLVGGAVGSMFGMPQLGLMVGGMIGSTLFAPTVKGPRLNDLSVTVSTYGNAIPQLYGTARLSGNVIWSSGIKEHKKTSRAGKGGPKQTTYNYTASFAVAFCAGPAVAVNRIWADAKLMLGDAGSGPAAAAAYQSEFGGGTVDFTKVTSAGGLKGKKSTTTSVKFRFYSGSEDQIPDGLIVADKGADSAPAFRGLCYIVFEDLPLEEYGNRIPSITAEITKQPQSYAPHATPLYGDVVPSDAGIMCDYDGDRFYIFDNETNDLYTYSMTTMQPIRSVHIGLRGSRFTLSPGGGPMYCLGNGGNTNPIVIIDPTTGESNQFGHGGNGLADSPGGECQIYNPKTTPGFVAGIGEILGFYTKDSLGERTDYFMNISSFGTYSIYTSKMDYVKVFNNPLPTDVYSGYGSLAYGKVDADGTDIFNWKNMPGVAYHRWSFVPGAIGNTVDVQKSADCFGSVYAPPMVPFLQEETVEIGAVAVSVTVETIVTTTIDSTNKITTVEVDSRDQFGNLTTSVDSHPQKDTDVAGVKTTYVTSTTTYDFFEADWLLHDPTDNTINMAGRYHLGGTSIQGFLKWSITDRAVKVARVWNLSTDNNGFPIIVPPMSQQSRLRGGTIGWISEPFVGTNLGNTIDLQTGSISSFVFTDNDGFFGRVGNAGGVWDDLTQSLWCTPFFRKATRYFFRSYGSGDTLASIVEDICIKTTVLTDADIDVSQLQNIQVPGYVVSDNSTAKDCLNQLSSAFFFDGVESDYTLKFVPRGGEPVQTIVEDYLAPAEGTEHASIKETTTQEPELPMRVTINYYSMERDYQTGSQFAKRLTNPVPTMYSPTLLKSEIPIVLTANVAKQMADKALQTAWTNRTNVATTLPWRYILLDPSDVVSINMDSGLTYRLRIDKFDIGTDYSIQFTGITERAVTYTSQAVGDSGSFPVQSAGGSGTAYPLVLNTPLLRDLDDTQGKGSLYYVGYGTETGVKSKGAAIEQSKTGQDYSTITVLTGPAETGLCSNALAAVVDGEATDEVNTLTVTFPTTSITLETISQDDMLAGGNAALVGEEIIQFREVTHNDNGSWTLRGLLRGRRGTQYAIRGHKNSETFILLDAGSLDKALHSADDYNSTISIKAVANGTLVEDATPEVIDFEPNDLKPYTPEYLKASSSAGTVTVTFERRSRISFGILDFITDAYYFEGQGPAARMKWQVFFGADINDPTILKGTATPDQSGETMIYNPDGSFADLQAQFPFSVVTHAANPSFVIRIWEVGFVDGFPKIAKFTAPPNPDGTPADGQWAYAELY